MNTACFSIRVLGVLTFVSTLAQSVVYGEPPPSIDGTYELTERVMVNGTILRPLSIMALYTMAGGRFSLNLFVKNADGTIASESSVGRYTFTAEKYCEWIVYTIRSNLDKPGVTNEVPAVTDPCPSVTAKDGPIRFLTTWEGVEVSFGAEGFTAKIGGEFVDHWRKIQ
jgi:hypothetical protein